MLIVYSCEVSKRQRQRMYRLGNQIFTLRMKWIYSLLLYNITFYTEL